MPEFDIDTSGNESGIMTVEFEVYCETCGAGLCKYATGVNAYRRNMPEVRVETCPTCRKMIEDEAYQRGREAGYSDGYDDGYEDAGGTT